ncbi:MAG TPA: hypothetical protein VGF90_04220, partial [Verrucomicrobiae bacterium]
MRRFILGLLAFAALGAAIAYAQNWGGGPSQGTGYPSNAIPLVASGTGTVGVVTATLPASTTGLTTFICTFVVTSAGATGGSVGTGTVAPLVGGTSFPFVFIDPSAGQGLVGVVFTPCVPASALNTAIVVTKPAFGGTGTPNVAIGLTG